MTLRVLVLRTYVKTMFLRRRKLWRVEHILEYQDADGTWKSLPTVEQERDL